MKTALAGLAFTRFPTGCAAARDDMQHGATRATELPAASFTVADRAGRGLPREAATVAAESAKSHHGDAYISACSGRVVSLGRTSYGGGSLHCRDGRRRAVEDCLRRVQHNGWPMRMMPGGGAGAVRHTDRHAPPAH